MTPSNVLVVDDIYANRLAIAQVLEPLDNIKLVEAESGEQALSALLTQSFAIILLDINMPGMSGYETAELISLNKDTRDTPIVMVTAHGQSSPDILKAYDSGAVDYILKPIEPVVLLNKVKQFVTLDQSNKRSVYIREQRDRILNAAGEGVIDVDPQGIIQYCNRQAQNLLREEEKQVIGSNFNNWFRPSEPGKDFDLFHKLYSEVELSGKTEHRNAQLTAKKTPHLPVELICTVEKIHDQKSMTIIFEDITDRLAMVQNLSHMANYDVLTNLANRSYFHETLNNSLMRQRRHESSLALLFLDLDHFKYVNDNFGHDAGDDLLKICAERLLNCVRETDFVARIGGDEFAIILYEVHKISDITSITDKIIAVLSESMTLGTNQITTSTSIGIAVYDEKSPLTLDALIKSADTAMYEAKSSGRNNYKFFAEEMQRKSQEKQRIQIMLHQAIPNDELFLVYQPKICLSKKTISGCEVLIRWKPNEAEHIPPDQFIPISEESGQIIMLGEWALKKAFSQIKSWLPLPSFKNMTVAINVSTIQLKQGTFYTLVKQQLKLFDIPPETIEFEITETGVVDSLDQVIKELELLHDLGIKISIDDFGTGNSSLDHLRKLPLDILKIDRSFVKDIGIDDQDEKIIQIVMAIAKTMNLDVIAEGAETKEQIEFLASLHCDLIQGYFFSKPLSAEEMTSALTKERSFLAKTFKKLEL